MGNLVIVQQINTHWTKASRGGESAGRRNAVPEIACVPIERIAGEPHSLVHHRISYGERSGFAHPREEICINPTIAPLVVGCVTIGYTDHEARAAFYYERGCGGAPERGWAQQTIHLAVNEWGQIVYNGRFGGWDCGWWYEKTVVNIGLFEHITSDVFTRRKPDYRFAAMAKLF